MVGLRKIQEACCYDTGKAGKSEFDGFDENDFNGEVARCIIRLLPVKKTESAADKVIKFFGSFLKHASEKGRVHVMPELIHANAVQIRRLQWGTLVKTRWWKHRLADWPRIYFRCFYHYLLQRRKLFGIV